MLTRARDVLVIGAGIAGLAAARRVRATGASVAVIEKSRGFGGRAASRTVHGARVDTGAQFFTARDQRFRTQLDAWLADGTVRPWLRGVPTWTEGEGWRDAPADAHPRYACPAGMNALGKALAVGLDVVRETTVTRVRPASGGWQAQTAAGEAWCAERVILTPPLPQTLAVLGDLDLDDAVRATLESIAYAPCHAVAVGYAGVAPPPFLAVRLPAHPDLAWIAHDGSKRECGTEPVTVVLHGTPAFTRRSFAWSAEAIVAHLLAAAHPVLPWLGRPAWTHHHRWRFARPERFLPGGVLDLGDGLVVCGDAFGDGRIEGAYLAGMAAAQRVDRTTRTGGGTR